MNNKPNNKTKKAYEYFFHNQFESSIIVNDNIISKGIKTILGNDPVKGEYLLYCIIAKNITKEESNKEEVEFSIKPLMYPSEFETFTYKYQFSRFIPTITDGYYFPIFTERI